MDQGDVKVHAVVRWLVKGYWLDHHHDMNYDLRMTALRLSVGVLLSLCACDDQMSGALEPDGGVTPAARGGCMST